MNISSSKWRSERLPLLGSAIFAEVAEWKEEARTAGLDVIDLGIGSPDRPPSERIRKALSEEVLRVDRYSYPASQGAAAFREQAAKWLNHRFGVSIDPESEVLALMGSQDGLAHLALAVTNPGDSAIVPNPGYPIYTAGLAVAEVEPIYIPLREPNGFLPDLDAIPEEHWKRAKFILLNFPGNPVSAAADPAFFEKLIHMAKRRYTLVVHDLAYSEMAFDGYRPTSILEVPGAKDIAVEFHSLSKSFNMAGCRIGFIAGNREAVGALRDLKANLDYGVFDAVQQAGIVALQEDMERTGPPAGSVYERRRDVFTDMLRREGWNVPKPKATMFVWAPLPQPMLSSGWTSRRMAKELLLRSGVAVIPGDAFGSEGEGYVRIALVEEEDRLIEAARRVGRFIREETEA